MFESVSFINLYDIIYLYNKEKVINIKNLFLWFYFLNNLKKNSPQEKNPLWNVRDSLFLYDHILFLRILKPFLVVDTWFYYLFLNYILCVKIIFRPVTPYLQHYVLPRSLWLLKPSLWVESWKFVLKHLQIFTTYKIIFYPFTALFSTPILFRDYLSRLC